MQSMLFADSIWYPDFVRFETDPDFAKAKTLEELSNLVCRVIGSRWRDSFVFRLQKVANAGDRDAYEIFEEDGKIVICGPNGISLASGFNYYLKHYAHVNYNPIYLSNTRMPETLPPFQEHIIKKTSYQYRYALNFCTYGYTMAFWNWEDYETLLDWLAMNGVNLMLDIVGQEEIQRLLLQKYGYTDEEIKRYLPGPTYLPWFFMQNMSGFGGPLPDEWFPHRVELARQLHSRMQIFGIKPIFPGYAGMVPADFSEKHPDAAVIEQGLWCGFRRPSMLMTHCQGRDYFDEMADAYYELQTQVFGPVTNFYAVDPFHEGGNMAGMDPSTVYRIIQKKMLQYNPDAIWIFMQWQGQLTDEKICNLMSPEQALILDLQADRRCYNELMERHRIPWLWCMIHNFGGRMGTDGDVVTLANKIPDTYRERQYMKGIGAAPEAFSNGPIVYDLLFDMAWTQEPVDSSQYVRSYIDSRYGGADSNLQKAWDILLHTAYWEKTIYTQGAGETVINARPALTYQSASTWGHSIFEYDQKQFEGALPYFIAAYDDYKDRETFIYDMVDVTKQILSTMAIRYHERMIAAYRRKDIPGFITSSQQFLELIRTQDAVLSCCPQFSVEPWISKAREVLPGTDKSVKNLFEFNARALITTWGDYENSENCLLDYSNRQWSGLTGEYYLARWEDFVSRHLESLKTAQEPKPADYFQMEWAWANKKTDETAPAARKGSQPDLKALAQKVFDTYSLTAFEKNPDSAAVHRTVNLALGAAVTGNTDAEKEYPFSNLTDGRMDTVWKASQAQWPVVLTVDLGSQQRIDEIAFSLPQVAGDYPLTYSIRVYHDGVWTRIPTENRPTLLGTITVPCSCAASKIQYQFDAKGSQRTLPAQLAELWVCRYESSANP